MPFFDDIDDELTSELTADFSDVFTAIRDLMNLLNVDSYKEMGDDNAPLENLLNSEKKLAEELRHDLRDSLPEIPDPYTIHAFLTAYRMEARYPESVGDFSETVSSIELQTLPEFRVRKLDPQVREKVYRSLCEKFALSDRALNLIEVEYAKAKQQLQRRREFTDAVREILITPDNEPVPPERRKEIFDLYFPGNPLRASEVEMVITRTCLYWSIPKKGEIEPRDSEAETEEVEAWLKYTGRFSYQYFSHFPTFSSFDGRDADSKLLETLGKKLGWKESEIIDLLNSSTTIEKTSEIEKYLIHDTWGHMWQGDLTNLRQLYDRMESLKTPIDASDHLTLPNGNVISLLDLLYLTREGTIRYDEEMAAEYIDEWIRVRVEALLAPIVAELTADVVEFKYQLDNCGSDTPLPSSSLFSANPAKLDFAWVDIGYFVRTLQRTNAAYTKSEELRTNLIDRVCLLLKQKYPRQYKNIESPEALRTEIVAHLESFFGQVEERQARHLNQELITKDADGDAVPEANGFFLLFTNFLRIQFTLNQLIREHLPPHSDDEPDLFNVLILFIAHYFQDDPLHRFWDLDEALGDYLPGLLAIAREAEKREA